MKLNGFFSLDEIPMKNNEDIKSSYDVEKVMNMIREINYEKEIDNLKEGFFSNLSHEFLTPLNMILSVVQHLEQKLYSQEVDNIDEIYVEDIKHIRRNALRLLKISNNFIDLTKIQTSSYNYAPKNHDIVRFIEKICESVNSYRNFNGIKIVFDTYIEELIVKFDFFKLERCVLNIISNAIKFSNPNDVVLVSLTSSLDHVEISIKDNGVGIAKKKIDDIFNIFSDIESRLIKHSEGSGVGLAISKYFVKMHGGDILANSTEGTGSQFIIRIPNIKNRYEKIDYSYEKIEINSIHSIEMELSDIYDYSDSYKDK